MSGERRNWVERPEDFARTEDFNSIEGFIVSAEDQSDMEVTVEIDDLGVYVERVSMGLTSMNMTFAFPFEANDVLEWIAGLERQDNIRYELEEAVQSFLDVPVYEEEIVGMDKDDVEYLHEAKEEAVLDFVRALLWTSEIDLDGTDLVFIEDSGMPMEWPAAFKWVTETRSLTYRPYWPRPFGEAVARLYPDGRVALTWNERCGVAPLDDEGIEQPGPDTLIVDIPLYGDDDAVALYDRAYSAYWDIKRPGSNQNQESSA